MREHRYRRAESRPLRREYRAIGQIRLEESREDDAAGILPFQHGRWCLRVCRSRGESADQRRRTRQTADNQRHVMTFTAGQGSRRYLGGGGVLRRIEFLRDTPAAFHFASALAGGSSGRWVAGGSLAGKVSFNEASTASDAAACAAGRAASCRSASRQSCSAVPSGQPRACQS